MKKILPFSMSFLLLASIAASIPLLVLYYQNIGLSGAQIGLLSGIGPLIIIVAIPFWTGLADARSKHRLFLGLVLLVAAAALFALPWFSTFAPILLLIALYSFFFGPVTSFSDNAAMFTLDDERHLYGRVRLGGTLGFAIASTLTGFLVQAYGVRLAFWSAALLLLIAALVSRRLRYPPALAAKAPRESSPKLFRDPRWWLFLLVAFAAGIAFSAYADFLFAYLNQLGAPASVIGLTFTLGTVSEIPILFFGNKLVHRFGAFGLLLLSTAITGARLLLFGAAGSIGPILWLQLLNGFTSPATWVAAVAFADEAAPPGLSATAQGHLGAMAFGFGPAVGGFLGGLLLGTAGGHVLYYTFGAIILVIVAIVAIAERFLKKDG